MEALHLDLVLQQDTYSMIHKDFWEESVFPQLLFFKTFLVPLFQQFQVLATQELLEISLMT